MQVEDCCVRHSLELGFETYVPVYVVFEDQSRGDVLIKDSRPWMLLVYVPKASPHSHHLQR